MQSQSRIIQSCFSGPLGKHSLNARQKAESHSRVQFRHLGIHPQTVVIIAAVPKGAKQIEFGLVWLVRGDHAATFNGMKELGRMKTANRGIPP